MHRESEYPISMATSIPVYSNENAFRGHVLRHKNQALIQFQ